MGKKARKTRWRTLTIADEHSDSEESNTTTAQRLPKDYYPKSYYNKFPYSSQSTPRRRFQHDSTKSTRSSSTASENKITFNEDEYTRITTPRQDVLFKKGYLNKPKNYQTQTSTGTSTTSTGNSTGNGTPDHQSTDLEYESQFVFPNGFVDQNGIYYVNGYESYPLMLYNPPTYYTEFSNRKSKRYSTDSLTESMSPNNEEATSQDLSGGEASNNVSDYSGHHPVYNMIYPGYYVNDGCPPPEMVNGQSTIDQTRRIKKRRRRKTSNTQTTQDSSEYTEDESDSGDETKTENHPVSTQTNCHINDKEITNVIVEEKPDGNEIKEETTVVIEETETNIQNGLQTDTEELKVVIVTDKNYSNSSNNPEEKQESLDCFKESSPEVHQPTAETNTKATATKEELQNPSSERTEPTTSKLKPDAEEFIPRALRNSEAPLTSNLPFIKVPPNFVPIPVFPLGEFNGQNFNPAFIPPGIPINYLPPDPKIFPNFVSFVPNNFAPKSESGIGDHQQPYDGKVSSQIDKKETCDNPDTAKEDIVHQNKEPAEKVLVQNVNSKTIDIATIVSKLEEAAKEQEDQDAKKTIKQQEETPNSPRRKFYENKYSKVGPKYKNYRRNYYNSPQHSPQKKIVYNNENVNGLNNETDKINMHLNGEPSEQNLEINNEPPKCNGQPNGVLQNKADEPIQENQRQPNTPERAKRNWKYQNYQNGSPKWHQNNTVKDFRYRQNGKISMENDVKESKFKQNYKNYSEMLTKTQKQPVEHNNSEERGSERQKIPLESPKKETKIDPRVSPTKKPNQWISVSNRKKRKNRNTEESDANVEVQEIPREVQLQEIEEHSHTDLFESYDVNLLVDVIPPAKDEEIKTEITEEPEEEMKNNRVQDVAEPLNNIKDDKQEINGTPTTDTQEETVAEQQSVETDNVTPELEDVPKKETTTEAVEMPEINPILPQPEAPDKNKKKSKKGTQKPLTKRVIITDLDLSMNSEEIKTPIKKVVTKLNDIKVVTQKMEEKQEIENETTVAVDKPPSGSEEEKKKSKKKKKKSNKMMMSVSSLSSSNTTINIVDDSYDFLLESALSDDSVEKTNIEVSQELDKLIQRGMYNSLEEKIKSLNIDESDGFFKSIFSTISSREPSVEKSGFSQTPDIDNILQNTRKSCTPSSVSQENNSQNREINKVLPDLDSPAEDGLFLENPDLKEIPHDQNVTEDANEKTHTEEPDRDYDPTNEDATPTEAKSYPITQAVKEWMNKTREKTPDVVLLKSPSAIYKEFCESASESDIEVTDSKNSSLSSELNMAGEDEITIFTKQTGAESREGSMEQADLLEYWENDVDICEKTNERSGDKVLVEKSNRNSYVEEGEDVVEVYESKYGNNEDYLQLQKEIKEKTNGSRYSKQGNLPYRAICCSIM